MLIDDGRGKGVQAEVDSDNKLMVSSTTTPKYSVISKQKGTMFRWLSTYAATANDFVLYIKNTDLSNYLRLNRLIMISTVNTVWTVMKVTGGTPAGTAVTGINLNFSSGKTAAATVYGNAAVTGSPTGTNLGYFATLANTMGAATVDGAIILPVNTAWAIKASATGTVYVTLEGWFESI